MSGMTATPKKIVHWALEMSKSPQFGSPLSSAESNSSSCTSSLPYINAQLVAHGYTHQPGVSLDGTSKEDAEKVVKCLLAMLSQRIDDMSRTEDLTAKIRTLSYDHERLMAMYRTSIEQAANAEREMNLHKSRLASVNRTLQSTENAHKHTTIELQRTRTALQAIRATHQAEIKKFEKEKDRILEKWSKLADAQLTGGSSKSAPSAGFRCANAEVVEASEIQLRGKGKGLLEASLEQADQTRNELFEENIRLKGVILSSANEIQRMLHTARCLSAPEPLEEPPVLTALTMFPFAPSNAASEQLSTLLQGVKELLNHPIQSTTRASAPDQILEDDETKALEEKHSARETERLQRVIENLKEELDEAQTQSKAHAAQVQELFERFAEEQKATISATLKTKADAMDEENELIEQRAKELEDERIKFTEAAVQLGRERAALEAERIQFLEERRTWQVQAMLIDLPPVPVPDASLNEAGPSSSLINHIPPPDSPLHSPRRSGRKSLRKAKSSSSSAAINPVKKVRGTRRSPAIHKVKGKDKASSRVIPSFETEVIPPSPSHAMPAFKTNMTMSQPKVPKVIPPAFVLPPPSPAAQLPSKESLLSTTLIPPLPKLDIQPALQMPSTSGSSQVAEPMTIEPSESDTYSTGFMPQPPTTPGSRRPFPMAKPFVSHMTHAYSPVKPSPLSRILMLGNSPGSPELGKLVPGLDTLAEEDDSLGSPTPAFRAMAPSGPDIDLAMELGVMEGDRDEHLRDKYNEDLPPRPSSSLGRYPTARDKGKGRAQPSGSRSRESGSGAEKKKAKVKSTAAPLAMSKVIGGGVTKRTTRSSTRNAAAASSGAGPSTKPTAKPASKAGPRRVLIGSAEAAPAPAWRG